MISIDLAWPDKNLNPNARPHWAEKARLVKKARAAAGWAAKAAGADKIKADKLDLTISFLPPDARSRDTDNLIASLKASLDGLADVTGIDDSRFNLTIRRGDVVRNGLVRIEIQPGRDA